MGWARAYGLHYRGADLSSSSLFGALPLCLHCSARCYFISTSLKVQGWYVKYPVLAASTSLLCSHSACGGFLSLLNAPCFQRRRTFASQIELVTARRIVVRPMLGASGFVFNVLEFRLRFLDGISDRAICEGRAWVGHTTS